jgi:hypothetical protein
MFSTEDADILNCSAFSAHKSNLQTLTKRQHVCAEMLQTEQNYLAVLKTIISVSENFSIFSIVLNFTDIQKGARR